ncbi:MAG: hypothetical protein NC396_02625 [Bacteroides sp.]|nr:hypothetical protein [Bacteroides sp.]MCM1085086.1 hypothetical protein [Bacteroides sp.]
MNSLHINTFSGIIHRTEREFIQAERKIKRERPGKSEAFYAGRVKLILGGEINHEPKVEGIKSV